RVDVREIESCDGLRRTNDSPMVSPMLEAVRVCALQVHIFYYCKGIERSAGHCDQAFCGLNLTTIWGDHPAHELDGVFDTWSILCAGNCSRLIVFCFIGKSAGFGQSVQKRMVFHIVNRDSKIQVLSAYKMRSRDADHFPYHIEQWAAAAAGGDRRGDLQEFAPFLLDSSDSADNAVGDRRFERKWITYRHNSFSNLEPIRISEN